MGPSRADVSHSLYVAVNRYLCQLLLCNLHKSSPPLLVMVYKVSKVLVLYIRLASFCIKVRWSDKNSYLDLQTELRELFWSHFFSRGMNAAFRLQWVGSSFLWTSTGCVRQSCWTVSVWGPVACRWLLYDQAYFNRCHEWDDFGTMSYVVSSLSSPLHQWAGIKYQTMGRLQTCVNNSCHFGKSLIRHTSRGRLQCSSRLGCCSFH